MSKNLVMTFMSQAGKKVNLTVKNVKDNLKEADIEGIMDKIISTNIFTSSGGELKTKDAAKIVETNVSEFDVK